MATIDLDIIEELRKGCRCLYIAVESNVADDITRRAEALICRVEQAKEILEDFVVNDGGHYMTAARLIRRGKAVLWLKALKEEPDSVG